MNPKPDAPIPQHWESLMDRCPSEQTLRDLLTDQLPAEAASAVETHLEECVSCQQTLEKLIAVPLPFPASSTVNQPPPGEADAAFLRRLEKNPVGSHTIDTQGSLTRGIQSGRALPDIAGYEILEVLGQGGMGVVYKAWHKELRRFVALKMVLAGGHARSEDLARFRIEAEASARLQHPNIVQVHEVGEQGARPFLALEFVDGGSLARNLQGAPLEAEAAAKLVETLARAMHYAHQRGIIHRDLKPSNVLLSDGGGAGSESSGSSSHATFSSSRVPKITDFGLAKLMVGGSDQTRTGAILGTPSYMAPEQAGGRTKDISTAVDVYALGAILYELLTGRPPFRGDTVAHTLQQVLMEEALPPHRLKSNVPHDLDTICLKCLEKEPRQRYASALDLAEDLRRFHADEPIQARPTPFTQRTWKWAKRHPAAAGLILVIALSSNALLAGGLWYQNELENSLASVTSERDKVEKQRDESQQNLYRAQIPLAHRAWDAARMHKMTELLDAIEPRLPKQKDLRHFEWHYLRRLPHNNQMILTGHTGPVTAVAFRRDGRQLASASADGTIRIWDPDQMREMLPPLKGHIGKVTAVAYSADGKQLASTGADKQVCLWDPATGKLLRTLGMHADWGYYVSFDHDGRFLASTSADKSIKLWDLKKGGEPRTLLGHSAQVTAAVFSCDGKWLASAGADWRVRLWDLDTSAEPRVLNGHTGWVYGVVFGDDGKTLYSSSFDNSIRVWDTSTGNEIAKFLGHSGQIRGIALSPDGSRLASASFDHTVRLWDTQKSSEVMRFKGHDGRVNCVAFHPDGTRIASAGEDHFVRIWETTTPQDFRAGPKHESGPVTAVAFSPDNQRLISAGSNDDLVHVWDLTRGQLERPFIGNAGHVYALALRTDGNQMATAGAEHVIRVWDLARREPVRRLQGHTDRVTALAFSRDDQTLASASYDASVRVWSMANDDKPLNLAGHVGRVQGVAFSPDGKTLASAGTDKMVYLWDPATGAKRRSLEGHAGRVYCVAFCPYGKILASAGEDGAIILWDLATGTEAGRLEGHAGRVVSIAFTHDGERLASAGFSDKSVKIWTVTHRQELLSLNNQHAVHAVAFSPNGHLLASAGADPTVRIWDGTPVK
jgi:eukaryotic-like serine/threonine-protein kinase